jgi:hypothetical protein
VKSKEKAEEEWEIVWFDGWPGENILMIDLDRPGWKVTEKTSRMCDSVSWLLRKGIGDEPVSPLIEDASHISASSTQLARPAWQEFRGR